MNGEILNIMNVIQAFCHDRIKCDESARDRRASTVDEV